MEAVARWEALSFYFLLIVAEEKISFSYPRLIGNSEQLPSAYITKLGLNIEKADDQSRVASSIEELRRLQLRHFPENVNDELMPFIRHALKVEQYRESAALHDEYDGIIDLPLDPLDHVWSASQLNTLGQCAFKWFASKILKLEAAKSIETELSALTKGKLYHKTLELALKPAIGKNNPREIALENLEQAFLSAESDPEIGAINLPMWEAQRLEHLDVLRGTIESTDFLRSDAIVYQLEKNFEGMWCGLKLRGQVDRIDLLPNGVEVIDYKTGGKRPAGVKDHEGVAAIDIQIPIYLESAVPAILPIELTSDKQSTGLYFSISKAKILKQVSREQIDSAHQFAEKVKSHLLNGQYAVEPDTNEESCRYCDFDAVCRKGYRLKRKRQI